LFHFVGCFNKVMPPPIVACQQLAFPVAEEVLREKKLID
jgi:hypothetical protein